MIPCGCYGAIIGYKNRPRLKPGMISSRLGYKILLNTILNSAVKYGPANGNMCAILAMYFVSFKHFLPKYFPQLHSIENQRKLITASSTSALLLYRMGDFFSTSLTCLNVFFFLFNFFFVFNNI